MTINRRVQVVAGIILTIMWCVIFAHSRQSAERSSGELKLVRGTNVQTRNDADILDGWLDEVEKWWDVGKNHTKVRDALAPTVTGARLSTVQIQSKSKTRLMTVVLGTIVDPDGLIITKASEVEAKRNLICKFANGDRRNARIVGVIDRHDLALLKVNAKNLQSAQWNTSADIGAGSIVVTPNLSKSPTSVGIVSATNNKVKSDGVLGIKLRRRGRPVIIEVISDSAAEKAGLKANDVIISINSQRVSTESQAVDFIGKHLPGDLLTVLVNRNGKQVQCQATLGRYSELDEDNGDFQGYLGGKLSFRRSGFSNVIQHDTFLFPEQCGGPLVDLEGNVVGLNIARAERISSLALPSSVVLESIEKLMNSEVTKNQLANSN